LSGPKGEQPYVWYQRKGRPPSHFQPPGIAILSATATPKFSTASPLNRVKKKHRAHAATKIFTQFNGRNSRSITMKTVAIANVTGIVLQMPIPADKKDKAVAQNVRITKISSRYFLKLSVFIFSSKSSFQWFVINLFVM